MDLVFFASGSGTNFQSVIDAVEAGKIDAGIRGLITNKPDIGALERAKKYNIPAKVIKPGNFDSKDKYEAELLDTLAEWKPDLIVLAGYMIKIPESVIEAYPKRIINIHPALLPKYGGKGFYGLNVHKAVLDADEIETGCSVHLVNEEYDRGMVLAQRVVPVNPDDTPEILARRVLKEEHKLLPEVIKNYLSNLKDC